MIRLTNKCASREDAPATKAADSKEKDEEKRRGGPTGTRNQRIYEYDTIRHTRIIAALRKLASIFPSWVQLPISLTMSIRGQSSDDGISASRLPAIQAEREARQMCQRGPCLTKIPNSRSTAADADLLPRAAEKPVLLTSSVRVSSIAAQRQRLR